MKPALQDPRGRPAPASPFLAMLFARLICSDPACTAEAEARASTLAELETVACDCGCSLEVLGWPDHDGLGDDGDLEVVLLAA